MNKSYTNEGAIENYLLTDIDNSFSDQIERWIEAMSLYIDKFCNRPIATMSEEPETYLYDGDGCDTLLISDCHGITDVSIDGTPMTPFYEYPANKPYTSRISLDHQAFPCGKQNVAVTAFQAMYKIDDLPEDIKFACTVLVAGIINDQLFNEKKGTTERIGGYSISYKDDKQVEDYTEAKRILASYTKLVF